VTTHRQRKASRRNLAKARAARSRQAQRRRSAHTLNGLVVWLVAFAALLVVVAALVEATHGLIFLALVTFMAGNLWLRQRRKSAAKMRDDQARALRLEQAQHLDALLAATYTEFEHIVATLLAAIGYVIVRAGGGAGDLGADIVCRHANGQPVVVQCKRYATGNKVGSPDIQRFMGMAHLHHRSAGIYVTTSSYTKAATDLARNLSRPLRQLLTVSSARRSRLWAC
jgi:HJR/Mrr/RecB family endonuclease